jgi:hypothetical protein
MTTAWSYARAVGSEVADFFREPDWSYPATLDPSKPRFWAQLALMLILLVPCLIAAEITVEVSR